MHLLPLCIGIYSTERVLCKVQTACTYLLFSRCAHLSLSSNDSTQTASVAICSSCCAADDGLFDSHHTTPPLAIGINFDVAAEVLLTTIKNLFQSQCTNQHLN